MKLLIIAPELYPVPHARGTSVETCIFQIASRIAEQHSVTIVCRSADRLPNISTRGNLTIIRVAGGNKKRYLSNVIKTVKNMHFDFIQIDNRPEFVKRIRKAFPGKRISLFLHSLTYVTKPKASTSRVRTQLYDADVILTNSRSLRSELTKRYSVHKSKMKVVHLGANPAQFRPPSHHERKRARRKFRTGDSFSVVYIGRIIPIKGIPLLIRAAEHAAKRIPKLKLYLIGSGKGNYVQYIQRLAKRSDVQISLVKAIPRNAIHHAFWMADAIVYPSQAHEAFGLVIAEALASGIPAVASRNGGIREIIKHNYNGLLISNYRSSAAFAEAIIKVAKNHKFAEKIARNGRKTCLYTFNWRNTSEKLINIYQKTLIEK